MDRIVELAGQIWGPQFVVGIGVGVGEAWLRTAAQQAKEGLPVAGPSDLGRLLADAARSAAARRRAAADFSLVAPPRPSLRG